MLKLLADENIPKRLVRLLLERGLDVIRLIDLGKRGINDLEVIELANSQDRAILTRDSDYTQPQLLCKTEHGIVFIAYNPSKNELNSLAEMLATTLTAIKPKRCLLVIVRRRFIEVQE